MRSWGFSVGANDSAIPPQPQANLAVQIPFGLGRIDDDGGATFHTCITKPERDWASAIASEGEMGAQHGEPIAGSLIYNGDGCKPWARCGEAYPDGHRSHVVQERFFRISAGPREMNLLPSPIIGRQSQKQVPCA